MFHALNYLKSKKQISENVILLQPTSPFRNDKDILKAIKNMNKEVTTPYFLPTRIDLIGKNKNNYEPTNYNLNKENEKKVKEYIRKWGNLIFNYKNFFTTKIDYLEIKGAI